jgi:DNA-binding response OmpR family regulator
MHRLLVVDEDESFRWVLKRALERLGYGVEEAADGGQSVDRLVHTPIDLVILDLQIAGPAGVETIGLIRDLSAEVPIIAVSRFPIALDDAVAAGANLSLTKPFSLDELLGGVRLLLVGDRR